MNPPSSSSTASVPRIGATGWALLMMLVSASVLFFIDRQTLAILKSTLSEEFDLNNEAYGILITGYMIPYTLGYLVSGQIIDRWGTRRCASIFLLGMALATIGCGLARNFHELLAARVVLGIAESGVVPSIMVLITKRFPRERRGFVVTMHQALQSAGPIMTAPLVAAITLSHGWRSSFLLPGIFSLALAAVWFLSDREPRRSAAAAGPTDGTAKPAEPQPMRGLAALKFVLTSRRIRGVLIARLLTDPAWFFSSIGRPGFCRNGAVGRSPSWASGPGCPRRSLPSATW